jgi:hypothetical protein
MSKAAVWESSGEMAGLARLCAALLLSLCSASVRAAPAQPLLTITAGAVTKHFTAAELLSRTDLASIQIPPHVDYKVSLTLQAVPLLDLLAAFTLEGFDRLEASAGDGFVAQISFALIEAGKSGGSAAWVAIEDPNHPWPKLPGRNASAGPFYLIWQYPERSRVSNEQWPYMLEKLTAVQSPQLRCPATSLAAAQGRCGTSGRRPGQARRGGFRNPVFSLSSSERRWRVRYRPGPRAADGRDRLPDRSWTPRIGSRSEISKNLATTANAPVFFGRTAGH